MARPIILNPSHRRLCLAVVIPLALIFVVSASACDRPGSTSNARAHKQQTTDRQDDRGPTSRSADWKRVEADDLSSTATDQLELAKSAQKALGSRLKSELQTAISDKSFSGAVGFCRDRAPEIAAEVADEHRVKIGRTSHKLRNPDNTPPRWARPAVKRQIAETHIYRGPDEQLGYLKPIKLQGLCTSCHGHSDQLAPGVSEKLSKHYPRDQATGFQVGDLRGWFWVQTPPPDA